MTYSDYTTASEPTAVIDGKRVAVDRSALHLLAVNAMALAVALPSTAPSAASTDAASTDAAVA